MTGSYRAKLLLAFSTVAFFGSNVSCGMLQKAAGKSINNNSSPNANNSPSGGENSSEPPVDYLHIDDQALPIGLALREDDFDYVLYKLKENDRLYNFIPKSVTVSKGATNNAIVNSLPVMTATRVSAKAKETKFEGTAERNSPNWRGKFGLSIKSVNELEMTCQDGDLSILNGARTAFYKDLEDLDWFCKDAAIVSKNYDHHFHDEIDMKGTWEHLQYIGTAQHGSCGFKTKDKKRTFADDCLFLQKTLNDTSRVKRDGDVDLRKEIEIIKLKFRGIVDDISSDKNIWHESGTIEVVYNNWTGTITYQGGTNAPTYSFVKEGSTTPMTGTMSPRR